MDWKNRHVWIIGASAGIGRALATELDARGAKLSLSARNAEALADLNQSLANRHAVLPCDASKRQSLKEAASKLDSVDTLIYMAGEYTPSAILNITEDSLNSIIDINLKGPVHAVGGVLPAMRKKGRGTIVLCGSVAGYRGLPNGQPYSATKAALANFAETLYLEESKNGIDIRLISPGFVKTRMTAKNTFKMPAAITPEDAAKAIADGLEGHAFEIHFPKRFTFFMKLLRLLPSALYFKIATRL